MAALPTHTATVHVNSSVAVWLWTYGNHPRGRSSHNKKMDDRMQHQAVTKEVGVPGSGKEEAKVHQAIAKGLELGEDKHIVAHGY